MGRYLLGFLLLSLCYGDPRPVFASESPKADPHAKPADEHAKPPEPAVPKGPKRQYNPGKVLDFPSFDASAIGSAEKFSYRPQKGKAIMVVFVSSWCESCQVLINDLKQLARKYSNASCEVVFVFAHDTKKDAEGFIKEHQITQTALMANVELMTAFKNPEIPSVFMGDKWGYLAERVVKVKRDDINKIDDVMAKVNAL